MNQVSLHEEERYWLCDIENMNQISIAYEFLQDHLYDFKDAKTVWVKTHLSEKDYQQATLMLYVSADEISQWKPLLIFKNNNHVKKTQSRRK